MQDTNIELGERKLINLKHERFVSRFEQLALRPYLHCNERFLLCTIL